MDVDVLVASVRYQSLMHETKEYVHPFEHALDLQDLNRVLKVREVHLKKSVALGTIEAPLIADQSETARDQFDRFAAPSTRVSMRCRSDEWMEQKV